EADRQLAPPVGGVQSRLVEERKQVAAAGPRARVQGLAGRARPGREGPVGRLAPPTAAGHGRAGPADRPGSGTAAQAHTGRASGGAWAARRGVPRRRGRRRGPRCAVAAVADFPAHRSPRDRASAGVRWPARWTEEGPYL